MNFPRWRDHLAVDFDGDIPERQFFRRRVRFARDWLVLEHEVDDRLRVSLALVEREWRRDGLVSLLGDFHDVSSRIARRHGEFANYVFTRFHHLYFW